jgi:hypothetical protein
MAKRRIAIFSAVALTILMVTFTGSALAGNDNGNGGGGVNAEAIPATHAASPDAGNSANAPGHLQQDPATTKSADAGNSANAPGQVKQDAGMTQTGVGTAETSGDGTNSRSGATKGSASQNTVATAGMKPANNTAKSTTCVTGSGSGGVTCAATTANVAATSLNKADTSKNYGNGKTAAQIAASRGGKRVTLYGPGNSQPHKVTGCKHKHAVDVHAVKSYTTTQCTRSTGTPTQSVTTSITKTTQVLGTTTQKTSTPAATGQVTTAGSAGRATASGHRSKAAAKASQSKPAGGVRGVLSSAGNAAGTTLPFTGFPLWAAAFAGLGLIATGLTLRRRATATV